MRCTRGLEGCKPKSAANGTEPGLPCCASLLAPEPKQFCAFLTSSAVLCWLVTFQEVVRFPILCIVPCQSIRCALRVSPSVCMCSDAALKLTRTLGFPVSVLPVWLGLRALLTRSQSRILKARDYSSLTLESLIVRSAICSVQSLSPSLPVTLSALRLLAVVFVLLGSHYTEPVQLVKYYLLRPLVLARRPIGAVLAWRIALPGCQSGQTKQLLRFTFYTDKS
jgi:hypothetical protein